MKVAILGSGNIATDLLMKLQQINAEVLMMAGIDANSAGIQRAASLGVPTTHKGIEGLTSASNFGDVRYVFDATSAQAHLRHAPILQAHEKITIDLTPAAVGPYVVPVSNLDEHLTAKNINMVTCGGQATIPIVWAVSRVAKVHWAEIVASIASKSAGPGTRANIDEFTRTTADAIEVVGKASKGKAIIILNPAEPPLLMRDTVYTLTDRADPEEIIASIHAVVEEVARYVPGYRLVQEPVVESLADQPISIPGEGLFDGMKVTTLLEVRGAGDWFEPYAGNLDIMTAAAVEMVRRLDTAPS